jgi:hypothetical protein
MERLLIKHVRHSMIDEKTPLESHELTLRSYSIAKSLKNVEERAIQIQCHFVPGPPSITSITI